MSKSLLIMDDDAKSFKTNLIIFRQWSANSFGFLPVFFLFPEFSPFSINLSTTFFERPIDIVICLLLNLTLRSLFEFAQVRLNVFLFA